jgi:hypothetical protein
VHAHLCVELDIVGLLLADHDGILQVEVDQRDHLVLGWLEECVFDVPAYLTPNSAQYCILVVTDLFTVLHPIFCKRKVCALSNSYVDPSKAQRISSTQHHVTNPHMNSGS